MLAAPDDADRIFYGATGRPLVTTTEVAGIVMELVPGEALSNVILTRWNDVGLCISQVDPNLVIDIRVVGTDA